ncbi:Nucleic acid- OB-fold protein [Rutstroemia sp. NJR-2017a WRK4]|nr:Nucleic acid- OB-fold protein [Rutstroemia sp. NJR-2017a WRK4]
MIGYSTAMRHKVLFLVGAPAASSLNWDERELLNDFTEPFVQFLHLPQTTSYATSENAQSILSTPGSAPAWRSLPLERQHLVTGVSQDHAYHPVCHGLDFFATTTFLSQSELQSQSLLDDSQVSVESVEKVISQFYEHSYAIHADVPSSQLAPHDTFLTGGESSYSTYSGDDSQLDSRLTDSFTGDRDIPIGGYITNLRDIPHAGYLNEILPGTVTVNIIAGIISVTPPREITTRRGAKTSLLEILVGDETRSGFGITFWLSGNAKDTTSEVLESLRVQDIVLMKDVALGSFRGKVHGQSLRKDRTKCILLYRDKIGRGDIGGCYGRRDFASKEPNAQLSKAKRVRDWVTSFVGVANVPKQGVKRAREMLPPDTQ